MAKKRFKVVEGSQSNSSCFSATVVDTSRHNSFDCDYSICECQDEEDAKIICNALNFWHEDQHFSYGIRESAKIKPNKK